MVAQVFGILGQGILAVDSFFNDIMESTGMLPVVIGMVILAIFFRMIISPLFAGKLGSDSVKKERNEEA